MRIYQRAHRFADRTAIYSSGETYTYATLSRRSERVTSFLLEHKHTSDLDGIRVAFMIAPGIDYVATQWGIWQAGGIAVPLCPDHPLDSIRYYLGAVQAGALIISREYLDEVLQLKSELNLSIWIIEEISGWAGSITPPVIDADRPAMILFTSGTTSKPKGVVTTHAIIESQIKTLVEAWEWSFDDAIVNVLPLHHVHGIINVVSCALWSGASCRFLPGFSPGAVWDILSSEKVSLFMAVPTIYYKLIDFWSTQPEENRTALSTGSSRLRLMVSGSAALPVRTLQRWQEITGHTLLERYGMTEIGMALSNPYRGERRPGHVGQPLPGVEIQLVNEQETPVTPGEAGEIFVKGPNIFKEYWDNPQATKEAFSDGWFRTGDIALVHHGSYRILGRNSVDIIKSGGYKISALEIEEVLRRNDSVDACAVVGIPDDEWGEIVCAALVGPGKRPSEEMLVLWMKQHLPKYQVPRRLIWIEALPCNTLGKVTKNAVKELFM